MAWIRSAALVVTLLVMDARVARADETGAPEGDPQQLGYAIGYQIGSDFHRQGLALDADRLIQGVLHALRGEEPALSRVEMRSALTVLRQQARAAEERQREAERGAESAEGSPPTPGDR
jgi:hypothetical protein